jgi:hypothetical protein|tara:strand:+ start:811 stop:921 length:111 start_codon:yes stop_codon:yes gene_type:complete
MTHAKNDPFQTKDTPEAMCEKISKGDLPVTKAKKKF